MSSYAGPTLYWQTCATCGERWMGTHVCDKSRIQRMHEDRETADRRFLAAISEKKVDIAPPQSAEMLALRAEVARLRKELAAALDDLRVWRGMCLNAREALRRPDLAKDDDDGCPKSDPDCMGRSDQCHDACETPAGPACGHSACSQHFIDTGSVECVEGETDGS